VPGALAAIARFGRRGIAGGGKIDLLESDPKPERIFIIEFPSADARGDGLGPTNIRRY
jgi:uncharacterized protein (DUF1330 family)